MIPESDISSTDLAMLGSELCRIQRVAEHLGAHPQAPALNFAARKIGRWLEGCGLQIVDLTGEDYDAGMAAEVSDIHGREGASVDPATRYRILRSIAPLLLRDGCVIAPARVVLEALRPPSPPWQTLLSLHRNAKRAMRRRRQVGADQQTPLPQKR